ncbi:MAG TPA: arylesterase [Gemmatimonadaceae bacterium]|nr:arylesterase [Gemmatimonadaceae bacterium]
MRVGASDAMIPNGSRSPRLALRGLLLATMMALFACGSSGSEENPRNPAEAKNNMSVAKGRDTAGSADVADSTAAKPVVLFFGTSLTAGYGLDPGQAFPSLIQKKAEAEGVPIKAVNAGLSGETTAGAARRIDWVLRTPADVVVVEAGANDALRGLPPDAAKANLERVIETIRQKQPRAKIVLVQMEAPPNYGASYTQRFRSIYRDVSQKERIPLIPFLLSGVAGVSRYNQADGVHPNLAGEQIVADNVWRGLKPIVAQLDRGLKRG